jgi:hypothetical protein
MQPSLRRLTQKDTSPLSIVTELGGNAIERCSQRTRFFVKSMHKYDSQLKSQCTHAFHSSNSLTVCLYLDIPILTTP